MATEKQIQANRLNALKSTGPKSPEGKSRAALNARKHGLLSRDMLLPGEKPKELEAFREAMLAELAPQGEFEEFLADRVVESAWRLRRAVRWEREIVEDKLWNERMSRAKHPDYHMDKLPSTGDRIAGTTMCGSETFDKLGRYEAHIERGLYRALHELQRVQAVRNGGRAPLPLAVDVDVAGLPAEGAAPLCQRREETRAGSESPTSASPGSRQGRDGMGKVEAEPQTGVGGSV